MKFVNTNFQLKKKWIKKKEKGSTWIKKKKKKKSTEGSIDLSNAKEVDLNDNGNNQDDVTTIDLPFTFTFYGEDYGVRFARKHVGWYFKYIPLSQRFKKYFNTLNNASEQISVIKNIFEYK